MSGAHGEMSKSRSSTCGTRCSGKLRSAGLVLLLTALAACASVAPLPEVDLADPAWQVWTGQALSQPDAQRSRLAGDILVAKHRNGDVYVSFTKTPLPIFSARTAGEHWRIDFVERDRSYAGKGKPPARFIWFRLPDILGGEPAPAGWVLEAKAPDEILLSHPDSAESIRVVLDP